MRTGEKGYGGIVLSLLTLNLIGIASKKDGVEIEVNGKKEIYSKGKAAIYLIIGYLIFFGIIWLIARLFSGGDKKER